MNKHRVCVCVRMCVDILARFVLYIYFHYKLQNYFIVNMKMLFDIVSCCNIFMIRTNTFTFSIAHHTIIELKRKSIL